MKHRSQEATTKKIDSQIYASIPSHPDSERAELKRNFLIPCTGLEFENATFFFLMAPGC